MKSIKYSFRRLKNNWLTNLFGVGGLTLGLVCVLFIFLRLNSDLSIDNFANDIDRIFRIYVYTEEDGGGATFEGAPPSVAPAVQNEYPQVELACRYVDYLDVAVKYEDNKTTAYPIYCDNSFFDIFSINLIRGVRYDEFAGNEIIITQTFASELFDRGVDPIGKIITINQTSGYEVVGIIKDFPKNSSFAKSKAILPLKAMKNEIIDDEFFETWYNNSFFTLVRLKDAGDAEVLDAAIRDRLKKENEGTPDLLKVVGWRDYHYEANDTIRNVKIFGLIALFIILAAILNFVNLNTAQSTKRSKDIGIYKILGAGKSQLIRLVYTDITLLCSLSFILAIAIVIIGFPTFNGYTDGKIEFSSIFQPVPMLILVGLFLLTVFASGAYSAFRLTQLSALQVVKSNFNSVKGKGIFRNAFILVVLTITMAIFSSVLTISEQVDHMKHIDLGIKNPEQVMYVILNNKMVKNRETLKDDLLKNPNIFSAAYSVMLPLHVGDNASCWDWEGKDPDFKPLVTSFSCDEDLEQVFDLKIIEGSARRKGQKGILINKTFADMIGWIEFEGKTLSYCGYECQVLGVFEDFKFNSLSKETGPLVLNGIPSWATSGVMMMRINAEEYSSVIDYMKEVQERFDPDMTFLYGFVDESYAELIKNEERLQKLTAVFSVFSLFVLLLGLLGTVMFLAEQRTKEFGIRKCLGESVISLIVRFVKPFFVWGVIASVISIPISMHLMNKWLENYTDRISLSVTPFIVVSLVTILVAVVTVIVQSLKTALDNPIKALKSE